MNATVYSALTTTGSPGAQGSYYFRPIDTGASPFPYVFSNNAGLVVEPNAIYFDKLFQNPQINQTECLCNRSWAAAPPSLSTIWAHTPIILPNFIDTHGSSAGKIVLWHRDQRQQHLTLPTGRFRPAAD